MSISASGGTSGNNSGSVSSFALPSYGSHSGQDIVIVVVLGSTSSSVSSITNSAGSYGTPALQVAQNGTGVRVEVWTIHVTTGASTVFTINITGGATSISATLEEYSGVSSIGHNDSQTGATLNLIDFGVATQDGNNWVVTGFGFACQSGDTLTAQVGNERQKSIPAATAVGGALYDNTQSLAASFGNATKANNNRNWAAASIELRTATTAITAADYGGTTVASLQVPRDIRYLKCLEPVFSQSNTGTGNPVPLGSILQSGTVGTAYSETLSVQGGTSPYSYAATAGALPPGLSLSSGGVISGTPSTAGTYSFTVQVTDAISRTNSQAFQIIVSAASGGGEFSYSFAA